MHISAAKYLHQLFNLSQFLPTHGRKGRKTVKNVEKKKKKLIKNKC